MIVKKNKQKIMVAMSGGIDSSVATTLLKKQGYDVIGVFMKFWSEDVEGAENRCCSIEAENRARKVASILNIPFYVFDFQKEFKKRIIDCFLKEYKSGHTPNPCVVCNKEIKFGLLLEKALKMDADFVATGHYARKGELKNGNYKLLKSKDKNKDQSYFLWQLNQKQLSKILFPIGDYTKPQVRKLAKKFKLPVLNIPESQEICFIPKTINDFLKKHLKQKLGPIVCSKPGVEQKIIGKHEGLWFYTIGQRKGINLSGGPFYVLSKNMKNNVLIVTKNEKDLYKKEMVCENTNWISGNPPPLIKSRGLRVKTKIRYRHSPAPATIIYKLKNLKTYKLMLDKPQRAITPGQSVVFYFGQEVLGGGIITKS